MDFEFNENCEYVILNGAVNIFNRATSCTHNLKTNGTIKWEHHIPEDMIRVCDLVVIHSKGPYNGHKGNVTSINSCSADVLFEYANLANFEPEQLVKVM